MGSLNTSRQKIKLLDIETLAANGVPAAGNPHATLKTPNNKFFVGSNNGQYVHVLNNIYGSLLGMTSVNTGLGGANADLSYNTVDNMIYGISTYVYSMDPNTLAVTPFYSIPGGGYNAALTNDGLNLYVGDNGYIRKYRISDQTFLTNYNFANGYVHSMKVTPDNQYVLATTISITGGGGKLIKIKISDGTVSTLDFSSTIGGTPTDDFVIIGDYIYVGDEYSYKGGKINWKNMTIDKVINLPMNCWFVSTDAQYVYFGARSNLIFCFDPTTENTATLNVPFNFPSIGSLNELVYIENNIWLGTNYVTNNAKIVRLYINPFSEADRTSAKISIKKQNLSSLIPFQIGIDVYPNNLYIFKSATTNLLGTIINPSLFNSPYEDIVNITPPNQNQLSFYFDGSEWIYSDFSPNGNNYVIPNNSIIQIQTLNITSVPVGGGAIIQKYYSGKISLYNKQFIPSALQGLSLWLKADAGVTLDGTNVTAWEDQSGNGNNATAVNNPVYISSLINGKPSIDFFTNTAYFDLDSNIDPTKTIFCVYKTNTSPSDYQAIVESNMGLYSAIAGNQFGVYLGTEIGYTTLSQNTPYILMVESEDGVNSNGYVNGTSYSNDSGLEFTSRSYTKIGTGGDATQPCNGYISEVIIYNRVLTTEERQQVEAYLNEKYEIY